MLNHALDGFSGRFQILSGIKITGVENKVFPDRGGQRQTQVGVDVDFAYSKMTGPEQHVFRYSLRAVDFAAILIALGDEFRQYGGGAMKN